MSKCRTIAGLTTPRTLHVRTPAPYRNVYPLRTSCPPLNPLCKSFISFVVHDYTHTPYLAHNLHTINVQKIGTLPHTHTIQDNNQTKYNLNIYAVDSSKALTRLDATIIHDNLTTTLTHEYGQTIRTTLIDAIQTDAHSIDIKKSCKDFIASANPHSTSNILHNKPHSLK